MAVEFVSTVGLTDYSFDWITEEITIEAGITEVSAADLKQAIHDAQDEGGSGIVRNPIANFGNPVTLTTTSSTFLNVILLSGWKINSFAVVGTLTVGDGNVVSLVDGIDIFGPNVFVNFVNNTSAAGVLVTGGSGVTPSDVTDIENAIFDRIVEGAFTFEQMIRLVTASAAGAIEQAADGSYTVRGVDAATARILGELGANNSRNVTARNGA